MAGESEQEEQSESDERQETDHLRADEKPYLSEQRPEDDSDKSAHKPLEAEDLFDMKEVAI